MDKNTRIVGAALAAAAGLFLAGCDNAETGDTAEDITEETTAPATETTTPAEDAMTSPAEDEEAIPETDFEESEMGSDVGGAGDEEGGPEGVVPEGGSDVGGAGTGEDAGAEG